MFAPPPPRFLLPLPLMCALSCPRRQPPPTQRFSVTPVSSHFQSLGWGLILRVAGSCSRLSAYLHGPHRKVSNPVINGRSGQRLTTGGN